LGPVLPCNHLRLRSFIVIAAWNRRLDVDRLVHKFSLLY
jgi:hypothetical protein